MFFQKPLETSLRFTHARAHPGGWLTFAEVAQNTIYIHSVLLCLGSDVITRACLRPSGNANGNTTVVHANGNTTVVQTVVANGSEEDGPFKRDTSQNDARSGIKCWQVLSKFAAIC